MANSNTPSKSMQEALKRARSQGPRVAADLTRMNPQAAAIISKLVKPVDQPRRDGYGNRIDNLPDINSYRNISEDTALAVSDAETIFDMLPDMKLCRQVLPSCILAPRDMVTMEITYEAPKDLAPPEVVQMLTNRTREHFDRDYKITGYLQKILEDALFNRGSYPILVIPENSIDELINRNIRPTMESIQTVINNNFLDNNKGVRSRGFLGPNDAGKVSTGTRNAFSFEHFGERIPVTKDQSVINFKGLFTIEKYDKETGKLLGVDKEQPGNVNGFEDTYLTVTDNPDVLKMPKLFEKMRDAMVEDAIPGAYSPEAYLKHETGMSDREIENMLYKAGSNRHEAVVRLRSDDQLARRSIGEPIILHLPSESVIPIFVPGNPAKQIAFFILVDEQGHPINSSEDPNYYQEMSNRLRTGGSFPSAMLQKVDSQVSGFDYTDRRHIARAVQIFSEMVETDLMQRLKNGPFAGGAEIASRDEIYRIMFARTLAKQQTNILFVPASMMTYFAFNYNRDGVGKSLMESMKVLLAIRVQLMFARVMAALRNSIGRTKMKVKFDSEDPNPMKTLETSVTEVVRTRQNYFPLGMSNPVDIADWIQRASIEVEYEGHPGMPDTGYEFEQYQSNIPEPNTELDEQLKKLSIMGVGLPPEQIDAGLQSEFATPLLQQSLLLTKRVIKDQETFEPLLSQHGRQVARQHPRLVNDLRSILLDNISKLIPKDKEKGLSDTETENKQAKANDKEENKELVDALKQRIDDQNNGEDATTSDDSGFGSTTTSSFADNAFGTGEDLESTGEEVESTGEEETNAEGSGDKKEMPTHAMKTVKAWGAIPASSTFGSNSTQSTKSDITNTVTNSTKDKYTPEQLVTVEAILNRYLSTFEMKLPRPNSATTTNQGVAFDEYAALLDKTLEAYMSEKWFTTGMAGEEAKLAEVWKESMRAYFLRQFMADNGIMPELGDIVATNDHGEAKIKMQDMIVSHFKSLVQTLGASQVQLKVVSAAMDKILDAAGVKPDEAGGGGFGGGGFGGGFGSSGGFGDTGGGFGEPGLDSSQEPGIGEPGLQGEGGNDGLTPPGGDTF